MTELQEVFFLDLSMSASLATHVILRVEDVRVLYARLSWDSNMRVEVAGKSNCWFMSWSQTDLTPGRVVHGLIVGLQGEVN